MHIREKMKPSDTLKKMHSDVARDLQKNKKHLNKFRRKINLLWIGLGCYFIGMGIFNLVVMESLISAIILWSLIAIPILGIRRGIKTGKRFTDVIRTTEEQIEDLGKEIYDTTEDEKLT